MNKRSLVMEFANVSAKPARAASTRGFQTATAAVAAKIVQDRILKRIESQRFTIHFVQDAMYVPNKIGLPPHIHQNGLTFYRPVRL
jgi:hypothetical protein